MKNKLKKLLPPYSLLLGGSNTPSEILTNEYYKEISKLKPKKILGKGTQGVVIETDDNNYVVKIYMSDPKSQYAFKKIYDYLFLNQSYPPTIYNSYYLDNKKNSLNRYINNNQLPQYFSVKTNEELKKLKENGFNMRTRLYEVMAKYDYSLNSFTNVLNTFSTNKRNKIINSLYYQGILTLMWLYIKKGIIHNDILEDNFLIKKTKDKYLKMKFYGYIFKIKLHGYYLVLTDFAHAKCLELFSYQDFPNIKPSKQMDYNPLYDIDYFIQIFHNKFNVTHPINDSIQTPQYWYVIREYMRDIDKHLFKNALQQFKIQYFVYFFMKILNQETTFL